jgi:hypothetical protein
MVLCNSPILVTHFGVLFGYRHLWVFFFFSFLFLPSFTSWFVGEDALLALGLLLHYYYCFDCFWFFSCVFTFVSTCLVLIVNGFSSLFIYILVWTPCLMHRCVCIWWYILQNYNYKLHFQNLSIYHISHGSIRTLAVENLDGWKSCDPWDSNIRLTMGKDWGWQIYVGFVADIDIKILGVPPTGARHAFPRQRHICRRRRELFISVRVFFPCMMPLMDGKLHKKRPRRPLPYVIYTGFLCKWESQRSSAWFHFWFFQFHLWCESSVEKHCSYYVNQQVWFQMYWGRDQCKP